MKAENRYIQFAAVLYSAMQFIATFIIFYLLGKLSALLAVFSLFLIWQILTELGYFWAYKRGWHSTAKGKDLVSYQGSLPFPDFVKNDENYLKQRSNLTTYARMMRLVFSFSCAFVLNFYYVLVITVITQTHLVDIGKILFTVSCLAMWGISLFIWFGYKRLFPKIFRLKITWLENNRPFFEEK